MKEGESIPFISGIESTRISTRVDPVNGAATHYLGRAVLLTA